MLFCLKKMPWSGKQQKKVPYCLQSAYVKKIEILTLKYCPRNNPPTSNHHQHTNFVKGTLCYLVSLKCAYTSSDSWIRRWSVLFCHGFVHCFGNDIVYSTVHWYCTLFSSFIFVSNLWNKRASIVGCVARIVMKCIPHEVCSIGQDVCKFEGNWLHIAKVINNFHILPSFDQLPAHGQKARADSLV